MASITKLNDGRYRARWRTPDGDSRSKTFTKKVEADRHLVAMEHGKLSGSYVDPSAGRVTVGDFWRTWESRQHWRTSSRDKVESYFADHVRDQIGRRPLNSLRRGDVESWGAGLRVAPRTARSIVQHLSTMLDAAVADGIIASNPARGANRPKVEDKPVVPLTAVEIDVLRAAAPAWFEVVLTLGLGAGLRQSEATGLTVDRVDFLRRQLVIDRQLVTPKVGQPTFGPPKTRWSYRTIPLADAVLEELAEHLRHHGSGEHDLVLHGPEGGPLDRQRFGRWWRTVRSDAARDGVRFHDTRHTYASVLLSGGVSVAAAAEYLGHSPAELLRTYAHLVPQDHDRARETVQAAFERDVAC